MQVPGVAAQVWHAPSHAAPQHTPSLQMPLAHSPPFTPQGCPFLSRHVPDPLQVELPVHCGLSSPFRTWVQVPVVQLWHG